MPIALILPPVIASACAVAGVSAMVTMVVSMMIVSGGAAAGASAPAVPNASSIAATAAPPVIIAFRCKPFLRMSFPPLVGGHVDAGLCASDGLSSGGVPRSR